MSLERNADAFWGGVLLLEWSGDPIEFAYTDKVVPTWPTRIFFRDSLPGYLVRRVFTGALLKVLSQQPDLVCYDEESALVRPGSSEPPLAILAPPETRLDRGRWKMLDVVVDDDEDDRAWWADRTASDRVEALIANARRLTDAPLQSDPFTRLHEALREVSSEAFDEHT